ncbi:uncharacterized protein LOC108929980 [Scleropages formosus]|uniref:uncharacterized protein LOC108929980 n=1 Tax=Scleropages formosus TaxID=113540 RepID=UPI0010FA6518|nr:uncharacterized protein LOC108929980 [Scleropages formosus]
MIRTLQHLGDLRRVTFGHMPPRHGLRLLYWFSINCVKFCWDGSMQLQCVPDAGEFGFHHYGNYENLFPSLRHQGYTYFVVGNLNCQTHQGSQDLPKYVREAYNDFIDSLDRNRDRIIISLHRITKLIKDIYITEHLPGSGDFNPYGTYLLSPELIEDIQEMSLTKFLISTGCTYNFTNESFNESINESINKSINESISGTTEESIDESIDKSDNDSSDSEGLEWLDTPKPKLEHQEEYHKSGTSQTHRTEQVLSHLPFSHACRTDPNSMQHHLPVNSDSDLEMQFSVQSSDIPEDLKNKLHLPSCAGPQLLMGEQQMENRSCVHSELKEHQLSCWTDEADVVVLIVIAVMILLGLVFHFLSLSAVLFTVLLLEVTPERPPQSWDRGRQGLALPMAPADAVLRRKCRRNKQKWKRK